jgi:hypothetical protein
VPRRLIRAVDDGEEYHAFSNVVLDPVDSYTVASDDVPSIGMGSLCGLRG